MQRSIEIALVLAALLCCANGYAAANTTDALPALDRVWSFRDPAASAQRFADLVTKAKQRNAQNYALEATTQLARALGMQQDFVTAHEYLDAVAQQINAQTPVKISVRLALERGRLFNSAGDAAKSVAFFEDAFTWAQQANLQYLAIDAAHMLAIAQPPEAALPWHEQGLSLALSATEPRAKSWLGPLRNNLAWTYNDLGRHEEALALFIADEKFRVRQNASFEASIARWSQAHTLRKLGRLNEALAILYDLLDHPDRQGNAAEGYTHEELGECLLLREDKGAAEHFALAYARLREDPWLVRNETARLERLKRLGESKLPPIAN